MFGVFKGANFTDLRLITRANNTFTTDFRAASYQACVDANGNLNGVRIGIADYSSTTEVIPPPTSITSLTKVGASQTGGGTTCYVNYIQHGVGIT